MYLGGHSIPIPKHIQTEIETKFKECTLREQRRNNLVIFQLQEEPATSQNERQQKDKQAFRELCSAILEEEIHPTKLYRLGPKIGNKTRPLKVELSENQTKHKILKNAIKLKDTPNFNSTAIAPDYTPQQLEERRLLVKELRRRKANGETNIQIRSGKITTVQPRQTVEPRQAPAAENRQDFQ